MILPNEPLPWQFTSDDAYIPITRHGETIAFCKPEYAPELVDLLNDQQQLRKALRLVCEEMVQRSKGRLGTVEALEDEYLSRAALPRTGTRAIALLLRNRQDELGVTDKEFGQFCDSYRLSPEKLQAIYEGEVLIESTLFAPLARILGQPIEDVIQIVQG